MLNRINRLTADRDFKKIFRKGRRIYGEGIRAVGMTNDLKVSRFGFVVSTKVDKRAVIRNRLERQMREIVRLRIADIKPGFDCVFTADKKALTLDFDQLTITITSIIKKAGILL